MAPHACGRANVVNTMLSFLQAMSRASPLQPSLVVDESLANGVAEKDSGLPAGAEGASLGISGDKPCGEKAKMGEEESLEEDKGTATVCNQVVGNTTTTSVTSTQVNSTMWSAEEEKYLQNLKMSISVDSADEERVSLSPLYYEFMC